MIACCGIDCSTCGAYIATKTDDDNRRAKVAEQWSEMYKAVIKPEDINCNGCLSDEQKFSHCDVCEIRACCIEKGLENCAACDLYACDKLEDFLNMAPDARAALDKLRQQ